MPRLNFRGFTLVEVMVAITVIAIATAVVVPNLRKFSQDQELTVAATDIKYALRSAQANAQSKVRCPASSISSTSWSLIFNSSNYHLQAQCSDNTIYNAPPVGLNNISIDTFCTGADIPLKFTKSEIEYPPSSFGCTNVFTIKLTSGFSNQSVCIKVDKGGAIYEITCP